MKELNLITLIAIFKEMLGIWFWPLVSIGIFAVLAFITLIIYDKKFIYKRFIYSQLIGLLGGILALIIITWLSFSGFTDASGPIDWILVVMIYIGGAISSMVVLYTLFGWISAFRKSCTR